MNLLAWVVLAILALAYVGGIVQYVASWRAAKRRPGVLSWLLALVWPWAIGAALLRWIEEMA